jgi:hypothetical protein
MIKPRVMRGLLLIVFKNKRIKSIIKNVEYNYT